jgi:repressor LexA
MLAEENHRGWVRLPKDYFKSAGANFFLLRVKGNSMNRAVVNGERIEDGDLALVRQQPRPESGEVVVVLVDGEATIKRLAKGPGYYLLKPDSTNPKHEPIIVAKDFLIQGVVTRILKRGSEFLKFVDE